jgi:outer membrane protein TolC
LTRCGIVLALGLAGAAAGRPAPARAQTESTPLALTRRQAIDTALADYPALQVARQQVAEARAQAVQAVAFPDLSLGADVTGESSLARPGSNTGYDLALGISVPFPTKFHLRGTMGRADVSSSEFAYVQLRQQTASQTAQAYDALLVALQHQADLEEGRRLAQEFLEKTQARYAAGTAAGLDVLKARVDLAQADNDLIANQRELANARSALNRLMGRMLGAAFTPADSLTVPDSLPALEALEDTARSERPELKSLASQRRGAAAATSLARSFWLPDLDIGLEQNGVRGAPTTYTTSIGFSLPLLFWNHTRGEVAEARHRELELSAAQRDLVAEVDQDVRTTYAAAATALRQALFLRDQLVPEARRAHQIALVSYGLGGASALDVLDARRTLLDAESQYAEALGAANDARADLERAIGRTLEAAVPGGETREH